MFETIILKVISIIILLLVDGGIEPVEFIL